MALKEYRQKRDFHQTREPAGQGKASARANSQFFVVQKHAATRLHYDFRLAMNGVLKSWAVPKGFPSRKGDRRLAVQVEDHPIEYADFEGTIPSGNYGAGTVMVWDKGHFQVQDSEPAQALEHGKLHLVLSGKKLKGEWALVRMRRPREEGKDQWLLMKVGADARPISARMDDESVLTQRSLQEIAAANDNQWQSNRRAAEKRVARVGVEKLEAPLRRQTRSRAQNARQPGDNVAVVLKGLPRAKPKFVEPMKALLVEELPKGPEWAYEVKFDGFRALAIKDGKKVSLISRNAKDLSGRYPQITEEMKTLSAKQVVLDGEIVAVDSEGRSSFQLLQAFQTPEAAKPSLVYYAFDIINLEGRSLVSLPLLARKNLLPEVIQNSKGTLRVSASIEGDSKRLSREMKKRALEGMIAKRRNSKYEPGQRSGAWVKYKWTNEQEFVIGGYTPPKGARGHFGAILVGYFDRRMLRFASKVGSGFDERLLASLFERFQKLIQKECPFENFSERHPAGLSTTDLKRCTWLRPQLVCQIRFSEWTRDGHLRQPVFLGLREDKMPTEVVRERPA